MKERKEKEKKGIKKTTKYEREGNKRKAKENEKGNTIIKKKERVKI